MTVSIAWNAGALRGRLLSLHRLGSRGGRELAHAASLADALASLESGPYGHDVKRGLTLPAAQWAVAATPLWHLRVLAGWLPPAGAELIRVLAGWWEALNVENLLAGLAGGTRFRPYELGGLDTAWRRLRSATTQEAVRETLAASPWLDPGAADTAAIVTWLQLSWAQRVSDEAQAAARLAAGWAALAAARRRFLGSADLDESRARHVRLLGPRWLEADGLVELKQRLPTDAAWVLDGLEAAEDLWRAEVRWWRTLDESAQRLLRQPGSGPDAVVGAFGVLLADAHRVQGALEFAARAEPDEQTLDEAL